MPERAPSFSMRSENCHLRLTLATSPPVIAVTPAPFTIVGSDPIPGDINGDGTVGILDYLEMVDMWGPCPLPCPPSCPADLNGDCLVNITDFIMLVDYWTA